MKKWICGLITLMLMLQLAPMAFAADGGAGLSITPAQADVRLGSSVTLTAALAPENTPAQNVTWASENPDIATVSSNGVVSGVQPGLASITASSGGRRATCLVTVKPPATDVSLSQTKATLGQGSRLRLTANVGPENAYSTDIVWTTSAGGIATVDSTGLVVAKKVGKATITATNADSGASASCRITVLPAVKKVKLSKTKATVGIGRTLKLKATATPNNAANKKITWTSSNPKVATVNSAGLVKTKAVGKTKITAQNKDSGKKAVCVVTVKKRNMQQEINAILAKHPNGSYFGKCGPFVSYVHEQLFGSYNGFSDNSKWGGKYVATEQIGDAARGKDQIYALLNQAKPGDIIYAHPLAAGKVEHYAIYLGHDSNYLYLYEANWDNRGGVRYRASQTYNWYTDSREVYLYRAKDYKILYG